MLRVLCLDTKGIVEHLVGDDVNIFGHAHVNACVWGVRDDVLRYQSIFTELREDAVKVDILNDIVMNSVIVGALGGDTVTAVINLNEKAYENINAVINLVLLNLI